MAQHWRFTRTVDLYGLADGDCRAPNHRDFMAAVDDLFDLPEWGVRGHPTQGGIMFDSPRLKMRDVPHAVIWEGPWTYQAEAVSDEQVGEEPDGLR